MVYSYGLGPSYEHKNIRVRTLSSSFTNSKHYQELDCFVIASLTKHIENLCVFFHQLTKLLRALEFKFHQLPTIVLYWFGLGILKGP